MPLPNDMTLDDAVPSESKYLKKEDVGEKGVNLIISAVDSVTMKDNGQDTQKTILMWTDSRFKPMVLNKTNKNRLAAIHQAKTVGDITGKEINVYNDRLVEMGGELVGGLRIREVQNYSNPNNAAEPSPGTPQQPDDEVPF